MGKSQALYKQAKQLIPGGTQLLSKRPEMFLPDQWPAYYKKAKGVEVWDLDGKKYIDMSIMGIGANILGYAHPQVNRAVMKAIKDGNMSTLNCYEEFELAQKLIKLHPWAQMARFSKTGGEACAIGVRIGRAYSKKDKVAFCGYHGWHDWYLAANLADDKNLDGQLLPGLEPLGVPRALKGTSLPFRYGQIEELKELVAKNKDEIGVIIMEVGRHKKVDVVFLKEVKAIAKDIGAVLIFDEVSSGFRVTTGGMHLLYGVNPDIAILGKALGNGYPISAIIGRKDVMESAQNTFISSTYWTERIGFVAALEVIKIFERNNVAQHLIKVGEYIGKRLTDIFKKYSLNIEIVGFPSIPILAIKEEEPLVIKTIFTQEMLKKGFLATNAVYVSYAHTTVIVDQYLKASDETFKKIAKAIKSGTLKSLLKGPVCHAGFKRLT
ncbi:MAG: aminotransferase class III-fold pyridoxal phosphate-dependent enzyme [Candidatus Omnitrophica bacterium]|nr:aminotransferase class III-fold pyridoxal phosphate-dependent enzyme [Candidatus Omnitrophota bacterium]